MSSGPSLCDPLSDHRITPTFNIHRAPPGATPVPSRQRNRGKILQEPGDDPAPAAPHPALQPRARHCPECVSKCVRPGREASDKSISIPWDVASGRVPIPELLHQSHPSAELSCPLPALTPSPNPPVLQAWVCHSQLAEKALGHTVNCQRSHSLCTGWNPVPPKFTSTQNLRMGPFFGAGAFAGEVS